MSHFGAPYARIMANDVRDDDPHARLRSLPKLNSAGVRAMGTNLLMIRVDLTD
jgi:hypothetical protein